MARVAFFGVGLMGEPMAGHMLAAGHEVTIVAHRNRAPVDRLVARGAAEVATPAEASARSKAAIMMLPTVREVEMVIFGRQGLAEGMTPG
ncbi:MAG: NAD(P)-binding domain-containing protein [Armatimonadota bacterium]|nr:NAD(P)-binding domain-containing protein [Armatimonadota bacterium]